MGFELVSHAEGDALRVTNPVFEFAFDDYIDVRASELGSAFHLQAGVYRPQVIATWDAVRQTVRVRPLDPLRTELVYTLGVDTDQLRGTGARPTASAQEEWTFPIRSDATEQEQSDTPAITYAEDIRPILTDGCGCHWEPDTHLARLEYATLANRSEQRSERALVVPFEPARSYLVEKILADYPDRFGTAMPPPWSDENALTSSEVQRIHDWIAAGASE